MISHLIGFFIPSCLILSADFGLKCPPTGKRYALSQRASLMENYDDERSSA